MDERGFVGCAFVGPEFERYYTNRYEAMNYMESLKYEDVLFVATNLDYDLAMVFGPNIEKLRYFYADNRLLYAEFNDKSSNCQFWDTIRCIGFYSVATLGKMVGINKLPTPRVLLDESVNRPLWVCDKHDEVECIECYCIQDARITREAYMMFSREMQSLNCPLKTTIASTAINLWKNSTPRKLQKSLRKDYDSMCREAYYGGRAEVFRVGYADYINEYDVNSLYPYVMRTFQYPNTDHLAFLSFDHKWSKIEDREGVANVELVAPDIKIPLLPYRYSNKLIFPTGTFEGTYTLVELRKAVQLGYEILNVNWSLTTFETIQPFRHFVDGLYKYRLLYKSSGNPLENVYKILLNSTYGKFGQRQSGSIGWLREIEAKDFDAPIHPVNVIDLNKTAMVIDQINNSYTPTYLNVLWASYITAYARLHLYSLMEQVDFNVYYCDTDAIFTPEKMETSDSLGAVKEEISGHSGVFISPKFYSVTDNNGNTSYKVKGVPSGKQQQYYDGDQVTFTIPVSIMQGLKNGITPASWQIIQRTYHYEFDKRRLEPLDTNGFTGYATTSPVKLVNGDPDDLISSSELKSLVTKLRSR